MVGEAGVAEKVVGVVRGNREAQQRATIDCPAISAESTDHGPVPALALFAVVAHYESQRGDQRKS